MDTETSTAELRDQTGTEPLASPSADPAPVLSPAPPDQTMAPATGTTTQPDIPTLLIDTVAAVVFNRVKALLDDTQKIKEPGIPLPVVPEKPQVLELPEVNMDLVPGQITLPGNSGATEPEIPRILIDTVVAVVLKEFAPLLQDLQKIRDQGMAALGSQAAGPNGQPLVSDLLGRGAVAAGMDEKTRMASMKAREDQLNYRMQKFQERYEALKRTAQQKRGQ
ncbi:hypothetical protein ACSV9I_10855 [Rhizobium sp. G187]|uniref:hypothetical protein n=1 Tax=Rhizobium sp. G187 TaxID=3451352 RepID=UPI003EE52D7E